MSLLLMLSLALAAGPAQKTLASPGLSSINIDERVAAFYSEFFAQELAQKTGYRVFTQGEVAALLGLERQRQLLGCSEDASSCMSELAGALGADGLITGSIARLGSGFAVTLNVVSPQGAHSLAMRTGRSKDEDALLDWLTETAGLVAVQLKTSFASPGSVMVEPELKVPAGAPRRIARDGKLFSELETARYFHARGKGLPEPEAIRFARGLPPLDAGIVVVAAPAADAGVTRPFVPGPPPRRVARDGKLLSEAQTRRYLEARDGGRSETDAFAWARTTPVEDPPPAVVPEVQRPVTGPDAGVLRLPPGLPKRIARDGKLLTVEETERHFLEKFGGPAR